VTVHKHQTILDINKNLNSFVDHPYSVITKLIGFRHHITLRC